MRFRVTRLCAAKLSGRPQHLALPSCLFLIEKLHNTTLTLLGTVVAFVCFFVRRRTLFQGTQTVLPFFPAVVFNFATDDPIWTLRVVLSTPTHLASRLPRLSFPRGLCSCVTSRVVLSTA